MASSQPNNLDDTPTLRLHNLSLSYGRVNVLKQIRLALHKGEIHALIGEHGAGKSSLCSVLAGLLKPTTGKIIFQHTLYDIFTPKIARKLGIELVPQHSVLFENLSIAENLFVSKEAYASPVYNHKELVERAEAYLSRLGFGVEPTLKLHVLDPSDRILIDILRHIYLKPTLLILDESLDKLKTEALHKVLDLLTAMKQQGTSILFVTHRIDDIYQIADEVTVMKDGEIFISDSVKNIDKINLIKFAYTEMTKPGHGEVTRQEFYQLLKYNEAILQNLPVNLLAVDNDMRIKLVNDQAKMLFQLEDTTYFNLPLGQLFGPENNEVYNLLKTALDRQQSETFYNIRLSTNHEETHNNIIVNPVYDETFRIGTIIIIEDISEQEQLREQVVFSEKLASTGLLAAGVAHEINNPLEIMHNYLEFLKHDVHDEQHREILETLNNQTEAIAQIVSNLVIFSDTPTSGRERFDLNLLIENILRLIKFNAQHQQIHIHFDHSQEVLSVHANKTEIQQVLLNLFKNSFDAILGGGQIFVQTSRFHENGSQFIRMTFSDTGPGICDENLNNIFLPFYSTKKGADNNLGLGLSVTYSIIKKYNGTITVQNFEDTGCQFVITLPQAD
jgi:PAS domain S-box-containing protein